MNNNKSSEFSIDLQAFAEIAKALSHPARLAIIKLLADKKVIKTGDTYEDLPITRPTVSRHLKILKKAGILRGNIDGPVIHYCLDMRILDRYRTVFHETC